MLTLLCTLSSLGISYRQPWLYHIFGAIPWLFLFLETQDTNGNCLICHCDGRRRRQTILFHKNETKQYKTKEKTHHQQQKKKTREHKLQVMKYRLLIVFVPTRLIFQSFVGLVLPTLRSLYRETWLRCSIPWSKPTGKLVRGVLLGAKDNETTRQTWVRKWSTISTFVISIHNIEERFSYVALNWSPNANHMNTDDCERLLNWYQVKISRNCGFRQPSRCR